VAEAEAARPADGVARAVGFFALLGTARDLEERARARFGAALRAAGRRLAVRFPAAAFFRDALRLGVAFRAVLRLRDDAPRAPPVRLADVREVFREPPRPPFFAFLAT
jgi:hypothetical protein